MALPEMSPRSKKILGLLGAAIAGAGLWLGLVNDAWDLACKVSTKWQFCRQPEAPAVDARPAAARPVRMIRPWQLTRQQAGDCKYLLLPALKTLYPIDATKPKINEVTFRLSGTGDDSASKQFGVVLYELGSVVSVKDVDSGIDYHTNLALYTLVDPTGRRRRLAEWMGRIRFTDDQFFAVTIRNEPYTYTGEEWSPVEIGREILRRKDFAVKPITIEQFRAQAGRITSFTWIPRCEDAPAGPVFAK